jgi:N-acetylgalactosamine kinase
LTQIFCSDSDAIEINNLDKDKYPPEKLSTNPFQKLREDFHWTNYFVCGYKAILSLNEKLMSRVKSPVGLKILIDSHVP